jgi:UV DNA damage endonuclease
MGYACINAELRNAGVFTNRTCRQQTVVERGMEFVIALLHKNLDDLMTILVWNEAHGIRLFRMSSGIAPHITNPALILKSRQRDITALAYDLSCVKDKLQAIGAYARKYGHRLTFHPDQYVNLGSPNPDIVIRGCRDLWYHTIVLDMMQLGPDSIAIIHGGGTYGDKPSAIKRWIEVFNTLPLAVKRRVAIENDETLYGIDDVLTISKSVRFFPRAGITKAAERPYRIPVILDLFHYKIYKSTRQQQSSLGAIMPSVISSWGPCTVKMHISEQSDTIPIIGAHSDFVKTMPAVVLTFPAVYSRKLDIMIEAKQREVALMFLRKKYRVLV